MTAQAIRKLTQEADRLLWENEFSRDGSPKRFVSQKEKKFRTKLILIPMGGKCR